MNIETLNELMKINNINSYLQLSKKIAIPYTTLLDLINGRGDKLSNIRLIADFFGVKISYLIEDNKKIITINEKNLVSVEKYIGYNFLSNLLSN